MGSRPFSHVAPAFIDELVTAARHAPEGDFVEVGVYRGGSAWHLGMVAEEQNRKLYLFDTFEGMPFQHPSLDTHPVGAFSDTSIENVKKLVPHAIIVKGVFPETMIDEIKTIALAHVDVDQYESTKSCCTVLAPRMAPGGLMIFDDYEFHEGCRQAVQEAFGQKLEFSPRRKARVRF